MADFIAALAGAMSGNGGQVPSPDRKKLEDAHRAAADHYGEVLRATNDKGEIKRAHDALLQATAALGN